MFDRVTCTHFLHQFYRDSTRGPRRVVVISDHAGYHHARLHKDWRAAVAPRFELSFLPPASPDLNSIEREWKLTRRRCLHNRYAPKLDDVSDAVEGTFESWRKGSETLRRLCAIS
ncbi:MAG: transposase [Thermoplasmata archaeon]